MPCQLNPFYSMLLMVCLLMAENKAVASQPTPLVIKVNPAGFGDASQRDIEKVLYSAAEQLWVYFPGRQLPPILVEHTGDSPIAKYKRGPNGELRVGLNVRGRYWAQFAYQFAHEFTHILSNYERVNAANNPNQWFEEALCETASMFVIYKMADQWQTNPPYSNWRDFAPHLKRYADDLRKKAEWQLPARTTFAEWYQSHEAELRKDPVNRAKNGVVALQLLAVLERRPENWAALGYMHLGKADEAESLAHFLEAWHAAVPAPLKAFVLETARLFKIEVQPN